MPISYATDNNGSSGDTYAFDVIKSGIFGSWTTSPAAINSDKGTVVTVSFINAVITYVSLFSIAFNAQSAKRVAKMRSVAVVSPALCVCSGNAVRFVMPAAVNLREIISAGRPE